MQIKSQFLHNGGSKFPRRWVLQLSWCQRPCDRARNFGVVKLQPTDGEILRNLQICHVKFSEIPFCQKSHQHQKEKSSLKPTQPQGASHPPMLNINLLELPGLRTEVFGVFQCISALNIINFRMSTHTNARLLVSPDVLMFSVLQFRAHVTRKRNYFRSNGMEKNKRRFIRSADWQAAERNSNGWRHCSGDPWLIRFSNRDFSDYGRNLFSGDVLKVAVRHRDSH